MVALANRLLSPVKHPTENRLKAISGAAMEAILILIGLAAVAWIFVGPFLFMAQSSRVRTLIQDFQKLRDELRSRTSVHTKQIELLNEELRQLRKQGATTFKSPAPPPATGFEGPKEDSYKVAPAPVSPPTSIRDILQPV